MNNQKDIDQQLKNNELATLTWEEYKYRHELCWNLIFKITLITATLSIIPYLKNSIIEKAEPLVFFTPLIGIAVAIFGKLRLLRELKILDDIRKAYRDIQTARFEKNIHTDEPSAFTFHAKIFMNSLILLATANFIIMLFVILEIQKLITITSPNSGLTQWRLQNMC
jgi:hypothetical protein